MIDCSYLHTLLDTVSYYEAAEGDAYLREAARRQEARQELRNYVRQFKQEDVLTVYRQLREEGNSFLVWEGDLT